MEKEIEKNWILKSKEWIINHSVSTLSMVGIVGVSSGFIYGFRRQSKKTNEEPVVVKMSTIPNKKRSFSWWEMKLGLDKKLNAPGAAWRALFAGTVLCWGVGGIVILSTSYLFNIRSFADFARKMEANVPKSPMVITEEETLPHEEMKHLSMVFNESLEEPNKRQF